MTLNEYQKQAQRTSSEGHDRILNGCMGLCGESGECMDILKKNTMQGHRLDRAKLAEELGDVMWYCAELASGLGMNLDDIANSNIKKLHARYPDGFSAERSINRTEGECNPEVVAHVKMNSEGEIEISGTQADIIVMYVCLKSALKDAGITDEMRKGAEEIWNRIHTDSDGICWQ